MKSVLLTVLSLLTFAPMTSALASGEAEFTTSCTISLIGVSSQSLQETKISAAAPATNGPRVSFDFGNAVLISYIQSTRDQTTGAPQPELTVELYKKGEGPIVGQINLAGLTDLTSLSVGQKSTVSSRSFLNLVYNGQNFSRVDYSCNIERVK